MGTNHNIIIWAPDRHTPRRADQRAPMCDPSITDGSVAALSPDGRTLATAELDYTLRWNVAG